MTARVPPKAHVMLAVLVALAPRLDLVSLITVAQWRYTPTLLNGVAVPVIMTVTVNFRLS